MLPRATPAAAPQAPAVAAEPDDLIHTEVTDIIESTRSYENWLGERLTLVAADLQAKHCLMDKDRFGFFRATFYRWAEQWGSLCEEFCDSPQVLGVADLHAENYGTWRDSEGRLVWGINDFDEVAFVPYTQDLIRLATSLLLRRPDVTLRVKPKEACRLVLEGYQQGLGQGGRPVVLAEHHKWLGVLALERVKDHATYWDRLNGQPAFLGKLPAGIEGMLSHGLPAGAHLIKVIHRRAGAGSLGRQRFCALFDWGGGMIAREAKALTVSAWSRVHPTRGCRILYGDLLPCIVRVPDPTVHAMDGWVVRRLAPDCSRIDLASLPTRYNQVRMFFMMGFELANVHLGTAGARSTILRDLRSRPDDWLLIASKRMAKGVKQDWTAWNQNPP